MGSDTAVAILKGGPFLLQLTCLLRINEQKEMPFPGAPKHRNSQENLRIPNTNAKSGLILPSYIIRAHKATGVCINLQISPGSWSSESERLCPQLHLCDLGLDPTGPLALLWLGRSSGPWLSTNCTVRRTPIAAICAVGTAIET